MRDRGDTTTVEQQDSTRSAHSVTVSPVHRRGGAHRLPAPPNAVRGRAAVIAVAAGAAVSAGSVAAQGGPTAQGDEIVLLANGEASVPSPSAPTPTPARTAQATPSAPMPLDVDVESPRVAMVSTLHAGTEIHAQREISEEQARRPKVMLPAHGTYTSKYAMRWGTFHGGIDLAAPEGTPEFAATDGTVIDAGPAQGFGQWVRIMSDDGVMTVYGHMNTILVSKGQRVIAGQQIALMGSQGFSTGSHLHFEVWINGGKTRTDPEPWLLEHGVTLPTYGG